jgi:hypothetical protein
MPPLEMGKDSQSRHELASALPTVSHYKTMHHSKEDAQEVSISLLSWLLGVVTHQRFFVNNNITKMCLECTILGQMGDTH